MYWLVGILVITIMIAVLDVADDIALPKVSLLESMPSSLVWLFLIITTILLLFIIQRNALPLNTSNSSLSKNPIAYSCFVLQAFSSSIGDFNSQSCSYWQCATSVIWPLAGRIDKAY